MLRRRVFIPPPNLRGGGAPVQARLHLFDVRGHDRARLAGLARADGLQDAPVVVRALAESITALKGRGLTILLSEQNVKFARRLADRAYIIEKGQIKFEGSFGRLDVDASLRRAYLGV